MMVLPIDFMAAQSANPQPAAPEQTPALLPPPPFVQPTFVQTNVESTSSPLSKRRRFVPNAFASAFPGLNTPSFDGQTYDSPVIEQLCEESQTPEEIEADLLQVGMRVRKSVAEGYKTPKKFTPRPFFNHRLSPETQQALMVGNNSTTNELPPYAASQNLATATFCGISLSYLAHHSSNWEDPSVSQQSLWNKYTTANKRRYEVDSSDSEDSQDWQPQTPTLMADHGMNLGMPMDYFNIDVDSMGDVSPLTQIGERARQNFQGRRIAMPRSRARQQEMAFEQPTSNYNPFSDMVVEQAPQQAFGGSGHRRMVSCGMEATMDFGEAPFLARREDVEMDCS